MDDDETPLQLSRPFTFSSFFVACTQRSFPILVRLVGCLDWAVHAPVPWREYARRLTFAGLYDCKVVLIQFWQVLIRRFFFREFSSEQFRL